MNLVSCMGIIKKHFSVGVKEDLWLPMTTPFSNELCGYGGNYGGSAYMGGILIYMFGSLLSDLLTSPSICMPHSFFGLTRTGNERRSEWLDEEEVEQVNWTIFFSSYFIYFGLLLSCFGYAVLQCRLRSCCWPSVLHPLLSPTFALVTLGLYFWQLGTPCWNMPSHRTRWVCG